MKSKSIDSVTNYERRNRSLKKKVLVNKKTNRIESVTKRKNDVTMKEKSREKEKDRMRLKSEGQAPGSLDKEKSLTVKKKIRLNTLTSEEMQATLTLTMSKNSQKNTKIWDAYMNNQGKLSQTTRVNVKSQQKQKLHEGNISKIKAKKDYLDKLPGVLFTNPID